MAVRTALITGGNRGIGYCIVRALATQTPTDQYIIASRTQEAIDKAIKSLKDTPEISSTIKNTRIEGVILDVTDDASITAAVESVKQRFGTLNILINNAGIAKMPTHDLAETRKIYNTVIDMNVTSVANVTTAFMPLLQSGSAAAGSARPLVINVSSSRGSLHRSTTGGLPPTLSVPYSISKTAVNALTIEFAKNYPDVSMYAICPGHCSTEFNNYRGKRDPLEGADVVAELVKKSVDDKGVANGDVGETGGFWETVGSDKVLRQVPW